MVFEFCRLKTSFTAPPPVPSLSEPMVSDFCQTRLYIAVSPCEKRFVALNCSESYQVSPSGANCAAMVPNCGYGRNACARVALAGNPAYGTVKPRAITDGLLIV